MKKQLLIPAVFIFSATNLLAQKVVEGKNADQLIPGSTMIRYTNQRTSPDYIRLSNSKRLTQQEGLKWISGVLGMKENETFELSRTETDQLGMTHYMYQHLYSGVPVMHSEYRLHMKDGFVQSLNGEFYSNLSMSTTPSISSADAIAAAKSHIGATQYRWESSSEETALKQRTNNPDATYAPQPELVIAPVSGNYLNPDFRLCWKMDIYATAPLSRNWVYVDAQTGQVIWTSERIHETDTPTTANTVFSGPQNIITDSFAGGYRLQDASRGNGVRTFDMNEGTDYGSAVDFTDADNVWGPTPAIDQYAIDAHWGAEMTYDYYFTTHNRNSLDNNGFELLSYVHFDQNYGNAFWDGAEMTYGDGDGSTFDEPLTTIDVTGHEITHGLTEHTANLEYQGESGALNESFSDIFGVTIDNFATGTTGALMWRIGEQCTADQQGIRLMNNPSAFQNPDTYEGNNWASTTGFDNGGVHTNSGVQNFWYVLVTEGGTGTNDNGDSYNVTGIGMANAADIAYRNLTVYLGANAQYADARFYAIEAANDLFGACSPEVITTTNAWYAVGVGNVFNPTVIADFAGSATTVCSAPASITFNNMSNNGENFVWYFGDGQTSTEENPTHTYTANGTYSISLAVDGGTCGTDSTSQSNYIQVNIPDAPTANDITTCGSQNIELNATSNGTATWYATANSTTPLFEGNTFITPVSSTTTFYVADEIDNGGGNVGPANNNFGGGGNHNNTSTQYIEFTVHQPITLETVDVFSGGSGNRTIQIWDADGNSVDDIVVSIPNGTNTVTLNKFLPAGSYRIGGTQMNLYRNNAGANYPYSLAGLVDITGSSAGSDFYYYFYNWSVSSSCVSDRTPVTVTIISNVQADFTYTNTGTDVTFSNASVGGTTYVWDFGDGNTSTAQNPTHTYANFGTYTVTLITTDGTCTDTMVINVLVSDVGIAEWNTGNISISPNPFNNEVAIEANGITTGTTLNIYAVNALSQKVADIFNGTAQKESETFVWSSPAGLAPGVYFIRIEQGSNRTTKRVVKY